MDENWAQGVGRGDVMDLGQWLDWQQSMHPKRIELGLERVRQVAGRMGLTRPAARVLTVAGTNGKGSTVAFAEAIARAAGYRVGAYTSPHLCRYNERVRIDGDEVEDADLIAAFEMVEAARGATALTFFEFGTLAALYLFERAGLDLAILEVGLGGRLDAVNLMDADVAIITTVALDHVEYLGPDRDRIGREKAGIVRPGKPAIIAEDDPPAALLDQAERIGAQVLRAFSAYHYGADAAGWHWQDAQECLHLPLPRLQAPAQLGNAAAAIAALRAMRPALALSADTIAAGVAQAHVPGRMQRLPGTPEWILDVAHNPQAAQQLAQWLRTHPASGPSHAVFAALTDKDVAGVVAALDEAFACWHLAGLQGARGQSATALQQVLQAASPGARSCCHEDVGAAVEAAAAALGGAGRVVVFGSFHTVGEAMTALNTRLPKAGPARS